MSVQRPLADSPSTPSSSPHRLFDRLSSPLFIVPLFATLGLIGILNHDMWRDEMNTWLIVRDSASLGEMLSYVNYQGHPALWALLVSLMKNIADTPVMMQLLHWAIGTGAIALFWSYSQFTRLQKVLFTFGYLPFYEYFLISRPYVVGMFCIFLFCTLYPSRKKSYVWVAIALGLMANSHAFAAIISLGATLALALEFLTDQSHRLAYWTHAKKYDLILSLVILSILYWFAFSILNPPPDSANSGGQSGWFLAFDLRRLFKVFGRLLGAYTLIVPNSRKWLDLIICDGIGISLFLITAIKLLRTRTSLLIYLFGTGGLLSFFYLRFMGHGTRHYGFLFLVMIAGLWLAQYDKEGDRPSINPPNFPKPLKINGKEFTVESIQTIVFTLILLFHLMGGLYRFPLDLSVPFSAAKETAQYIRSTQREDGLIVASPDTYMAALAGYLDRQLYYPELKGTGSFTIFQEGRRQTVTQEDILKQTRKLLRQTKECQALLVLTDPLEANHSNLAINPLIQFEQAWHRSEHMFLYEVTLARLPTQCR